MMGFIKPLIGVIALALVLAPNSSFLIFKEEPGPGLAVTLTFHIEFDLRAVMQGLAAVCATVGQAQVVDGESSRASALGQRVVGARLDDHPLTHPLHLARLQTDLRLQRSLPKLFPIHRLHTLSEHDLRLCISQTQIPSHTNIICMQNVYSLFIIL